MQPILSDRRHLIAYVAAWEVLGALIALLLALTDRFSWVEALVLALPLSALYAFICLGAFWVCRATPLTTAGLARVMGAQLAAAALSSLVLFQAALGWAGLLDRTALFPRPLREQADTLVPLLLGMGVALYLLSAAGHYLMAAFAASRRAETEALKYQVLSREAELRALRAQLHPHFLFNSLNSISALVGARPDEARRVCLLLADLLRQSLSAGKHDFATLGQELALVRSYLAVEKVRFGERLLVEEQIEAAAEACRVPSLLLQPLAENAVTHGIAALLEGGTVRVRAELRSGELVVALENPRDEAARSRPGTGLGLDSVRRRLDAVYGREATVAVTREPSSFRVELRLPLSPPAGRTPPT
ncbi:MAG TPA: histidine kinase [Vicinamibacteria bacterium]